MRGWYTVIKQLSETAFIGDIYHFDEIVASINGPDFETTEKHTRQVMKSLKALDETKKRTVGGMTFMEAYKLTEYASSLGQGKAYTSYVPGSVGEKKFSVRMKDRDGEWVYVYTPAAVRSHF